MLPRPTPVESGPPSTRLFRSDLAGAGRFSCSPRHPDFATAGPIGRHTFVFPGTAVWIEHEGARPFLGNPARVALYNAGQAYTRRACDPAGDHCTWFSLADEVAREVVALRDRRAAESPRGPLDRPYAPAPAATVLRQRRLRRYLESESAPDPLVAEEEIVRLFAEVVCGVYDHAGGAGRSQPPPDGRDVERVEEAGSLLYRTCTANHRLTDIARRVDTSVFHLCRRFRQLTGLTMHGYRHRIRLSHALEALGEGHPDLATLALELGYSSHSHFTGAFRRAFGVVPSEVRRQLA